MCFSTQVDRDLKRLSRRFGAEVSQQAFDRFHALQKFESHASAQKMKEILGLKRKPKSPFFKEADKDDRIYPGYFAPVIIREKGKRVIKAMRYRIRPAASTHELPSKYNVFNARMDALEKRHTWKKLFMKNHALFPFILFYEWVTDKTGRKILLRFNPGDRDLMWAPALYDTWSSKDGTVNFDSFALITDDPPTEIAQQGHDRCPIFLREDLIDTWLTPAHTSKTDMYTLLKHTEPIHYTHALAA